MNVDHIEEAIIALEDKVRTINRELIFIKHEEEIFGDIRNESEKEAIRNAKNAVIKAIAEMDKLWLEKAGGDTDFIDRRTQKKEKA